MEGMYPSSQMQPAHTSVETVVVVRDGEGGVACISYAGG